MPEDSIWDRKSVACNGKQLAFFRKLRGWTQYDLADRAGYSERLIRKAESGGSVMGLVLRDLAVALSQTDSTVTPEDLSCDPEQIAQTILRAHAELEAEWIRHIDHLLAKRVVLHCAGDPAKIPFAGEWRGRDGLDRWARIFFATMHRPQKDSYQPTFITQGNTVVAWGEDWCHVRGMDCPPLWVSQRFVFERGLLVIMDNLFDTAEGSAHLAEARARGMLPALPDDSEPS